MREGRGREPLSMRMGEEDEHTFEREHRADHIRSYSESYSYHHPHTPTSVHPPNLTHIQTTPLTSFTTHSPTLTTTNHTTSAATELDSLFHRNEQFERLISGQESEIDEASPAYCCVIPIRAVLFSIRGVDS